MPEIADRAPTDLMVTDYDRAHLVTYLRLLDAEAAGAAWEEAAELLLRIDPVKGRDTARLRYESHASRARWMAAGGYLDLLKAPRG